MTTNIVPASKIEARRARREWEAKWAQELRLLRIDPQHFEYFEDLRAAFYFELEEMSHAIREQRVARECGWQRTETARRWINYHAAELVEYKLDPDAFASFKGLRDAYRSALGNAIEAFAVKVLTLPLGHPDRIMHEAMAAAWTLLLDDGSPTDAGRIIDEALDRIEEQRRLRSALRVIDGGRQE